MLLTRLYVIYFYSDTGSIKGCCNYRDYAMVIQVKLNLKSNLVLANIILLALRLSLKDVELSK